MSPSSSPREGTSKPAKHPLPNPRLHPLDIGVREHCLPETHCLIASLVRLEYAEAGFVIHSIKLGPYGYEQRVAPLAKSGFPVYRLGLTLARTIRPVKEIMAIAERP